MPASRADQFSWPPPSSRTESSPIAPILSIRSTRSIPGPAPSWTRIWQPAFSRLAILSPSVDLVAMIVGYLLAVPTILDPIGILKCVSHIILVGLSPPSSLQFRVGSSARTVPIPTIMAEYLCLSLWTWPLASGPVIHWDLPVLVAILPSAVIAYFITTKGFLSLI